MKKTSCTQGSLLDMPTPEKKTPALPDMKKSMSRLERLMEELCPNGVPFELIRNICYTITPPKKLNKKDYMLTGKYPIIDQGHKFIIGYTNDNDSILKKSEYVIFGDHTREVKYVNFAFAQGADGVKILKTINNIIPKFLYYLLLNIKIENRGYNRHWTLVTEIKIPVPPLPVQEEIVRILDTFSELTSELTSELNKRKQQYQYYKNNLFHFNNVIWKKIGELTRVFSASRVHKNEWKNTGVPFYRSSDIISFFYRVENNRGKVFISNELYCNLSNRSGKFQKEDILITGGGTIGIPYIVPNDDPIYVKDADVICIKKNKYVISKFLYYYFLSTNFKEYLLSITNNAAIAHYTISQIEKTPIPVPPLEEQERIVSILDRFDALCNDLSSGLPAEIEARKKQYEYYRDRLLTFKEAK